MSAVADPDLLEPALGPYPPDTTVRTQVAWIPGGQHDPAGRHPRDAVKDVSANDLTPEYILRRIEEYNATAELRARCWPRASIRTSRPADATIVPATSGYLGVENQLYRVEVHAGGTAARTSGADLQVVARKRFGRVPYHGHRRQARHRHPSRW